MLKCKCIMIKLHANLIFSMGDQDPPIMSAKTIFLIEVSLFNCANRWYLQCRYATHVYIYVGMRVVEVIYSVTRVTGTTLSSWQRKNLLSAVNYFCSNSKLGTTHSYICTMVFRSGLGFAICFDRFRRLGGLCMRAEPVSYKYNISCTVKAKYSTVL